MDDEDSSKIKILVIVTKQDVVKNLVTKVRVMLNLPSWLKQRCVEDNKLSLRYVNGSQIKVVGIIEPRWIVLRNIIIDIR